MTQLKPRSGRFFAPDRLWKALAWLATPFRNAWVWLVTKLKALWTRLEPPLRKAWVRAEPRLRPVIAILAPIVAYLWRFVRSRLPKKGPHPRIQPPYHRRTGVFGHARNVGLVLFLFAFCLVYGFFFALTAPFLIGPFLAPVGLMAVLCVWALPDMKKLPTRTLERCLFAAMVGLILWPNYLCLALPGLPWITIQRVTTIPMAVLFVICLSGSQPFRYTIGSVLKEVPVIPVFLSIFVIQQFLTLPMAGSEFGTALSKTIIEQVSWTVPFFVSCYVFRTPGRVERYMAVLCVLVVPISMLTFLEFRNQNLVWLGHVPSFLKVDEAASIFQAVMRAADKTYRAKATFSTPLGLAEYVCLLTPFFIHFGMSAKYPRLIRAACFGMVVVVYQTVQWSGSRLGNVGMLISILLYFAGWALVRWRSNPKDSYAKYFVYAYPFGFAVVVFASFFQKRLHNMLFGGGAAQASTAARKAQLHMFWPKLVSNPFGLGSGQSGKLGFKSSSTVTVDNYFITLGMEYGIIGIVCFYGMFFGTMLYTAWMLLSKPRKLTQEELFLIPLSCAMAAFVVIKWVFSQADNHILMFMMLGMSAALIFRVQQKSAQAAEPEVAPMSAVNISPYRRPVPAAVLLRRRQTIPEAFRALPSDLDRKERL